MEVALRFTPCRFTQGDDVDFLLGLAVGNLNRAGFGGG
jgi:hypothetical protein